MLKIISKDEQKSAYDSLTTNRARHTAICLLSTRSCHAIPSGALLIMLYVLPIVQLTLFSLGMERVL